MKCPNCVRDVGRFLNFSYVKVGLAIPHWKGVCTYTILENKFLNFNPNPTQLPSPLKWHFGAFYGVDNSFFSNSFLTKYRGCRWFWTSIKIRTIVSFGGLPLYIAHWWSASTVLFPPVVRTDFMPNEYNRPCPIFTK